MHENVKKNKKTRMNFYYLIIGVFLIGISCKKQSSENQSLVLQPSIEALINNLEDSENDQIIVVAHRGDWRNAPENSLQAISNCIKMGVDMVEIDVRETKDGKLVLMHDETIDRTTNGKGFVKDWTLDSLKTLQLTDGLGVATFQRIPTLEEALLLSKDKILINLDKCYAIFDKCYEVMKRTNTLDQVIIKGLKTRPEVESEFGDYLDKVYFMPVVRLPNPEGEIIVDDYLENRLPIAFEFLIPQDSIKLIDDFDDIRSKGSSIWVNALWEDLCAGHDDEKAALDPTIYDWYIENDIDIIQTDRPQILIEYLREKGLHW